MAKLLYYYADSAEEQYPIWYEDHQKYKNCIPPADIGECPDPEVKKPSHPKCKGRVQHVCSP